MQLTSQPRYLDPSGSLVYVAALPVLVRAGSRYADLAALATARYESLMMHPDEAPFSDLDAAARRSAVGPAESSARAIPSNSIPVECFRVTTATANQESLYAWLERDQQEVATRILEVIHRQYVKEIDDFADILRVRPGEQPYLPVADTPLVLDGLLQLVAVFLDPKRDAVGFWYRCAWNPVRPCGVVVADRDKYYACSTHAAIIDLTALDELEEDALDNQ